MNVKVRTVTPNKNKCIQFAYENSLLLFYE